MCLGKTAEGVKPPDAEPAKSQETLTLKRTTHFNSQLISICVVFLSQYGNSHATYQTLLSELGNRA